MSPEEYLEIEPNFKYKLEISTIEFSRKSLGEIINFIGLCVCCSITKRSLHYFCYENYQDFSPDSYKNYFNSIVARFKEIKANDVKIFWKYKLANADIAQDENHLYFLREEDLVMAKLLLDRMP